MTIKPIVQACQQDDLESIVEIYNHYVCHSSVTMASEPLTYEAAITRFQHLYDHNLPYLVLKTADQNKIYGYAQANFFRPRKGWAKTLEVSIYLHPKHTGLGYGNLLMKGLIKAAQKTAAKSLISVVTKSEKDYSVRYHQKFGFDEVGTMKQAGFKNGKYYDIMFFQYCL